MDTLRKICILLQKNCILLLLVFSSLDLNGQTQVSITGNAPSYSNTDIIIKSYADPFTKKTITLCTLHVSEKGDFTTVFDLENITAAFIDIGIYRGNIFLEPGKSYKISFPEKKEKTKAEQLNPFFEPVDFLIPIENLNENDLNFKILTFNNAYFSYLDKFTLNMRSKSKSGILDSAIVALKSMTQETDISFYKEYVTYKIGYLKNLAFQQKSRSISKEYFETSPVLYNNPSYIELFHQVYNKYFYYFGRTNSGKKIFTDINTDKSLSKLTSTLKSDSVLLSDSLRELVILKNIYDEFYASNFSRSGLLAILDSLNQNTKNATTKTYATNIRDRITRLMPGYTPPPFELKDQNGKLVKLADFNGSYVYLCFCACSSYACIKEFDDLVKIYSKYTDKKFVIVTMANEDNWESMADFVKKSGYPWTFLFIGDDQELINKYDIRAYPTYFLIGPDGKLIFSPAISPAEGFELKLFQVMRSRNDI